MKRGILLALLLFVLSSCGFSADGGGRGTGITSTVQGNVAGVQNSGSATNNVDGIRVTVQRRAVHGVTDAAGVFTVQGHYEGDVTLLFTRRSDGLRAQSDISIPAGGTLTMNGIEIDNANGSVAAESQQVDFLGEIIQVDCSTQVLQMVAAKHAPDDSDSYALQLGNSSVVDSHGNPLSCSQLSDGEVGHVQAAINSDGSFGHARLVIE